jgi:uncharacterized membrane protein YgcG
MSYTSATGSSVHQTVSLIMAAKPLDIIIGQPTTETMNKMIEQMAQMVAPVKTTAWGGCHGSLALVLNNVDYSSITKVSVTSTTPVTQPDAINKGIMTTSTPLKILTFQEEMKKLQKEFDLQEEVTNISVQRIINSVKEQYIEELNKEYFGYTNNTIKSVLHHLRTNWCKLMTGERTDATEAFYQAWVPNMTHIITFGQKLTKQQKKCKAINVIISNEAKTLHFVGQMYKSDYFAEEQMTKYEILSDTNKVWDKTLAHFTDLFSLHKAYGNNKAANSGFESAAHVRDHSSAHSNTTANTKSDLTCNLYIKSLEESLATAREYCALDTTTRTPVPPAFNPLTRLQTELAKQRKQVLDIMAQNASLMAALSKGGGGGDSGGGGGSGGSGGGGSGGGRGKDGCSNHSSRHKNQCKEKKLCSNCNKVVVHNPAECFSLKANKDKCPTGWGTKCRE